MRKIAFVPVSALTAFRACGGWLSQRSVSSRSKHVGLYANRHVGAWEYERTTIKGVPAASFDGGRILEIYTGKTTITIYGQRPELVLRAARAPAKAAPKNVPAGVKPLR